VGASVTLSQDVWGDARFRVLGDLCGYSHYEAIARMAELWSWCIENQTDRPGEKRIRISLGASGATAIVDSDLAELVDGDIRVRGLDGRSEWYAPIAAKRAKAAIGGRARADKAARVGGRFAPAQVTSGTSDPPATASDSPATAPATPATDQRVTSHQDQRSEIRDQDLRDHTPAREARPKQTPTEAAERQALRAELFAAHKQLVAMLRAEGIGTGTRDIAEQGPWERNLGEHSANYTRTHGHAEGLVRLRADVLHAFEIAGAEARETESLKFLDANMLHADRLGRLLTRDLGEFPKSKGKRWPWSKSAPIALVTDEQAKRAEEDRLRRMGLLPELPEVIAARRAEMLEMEREFAAEMANPHRVRAGSRS